MNLNSILRMLNAVFQNCLDFLYLDHVRYLPQGNIHPNYYGKVSCVNILNKYLKSDGTYKRSLPVYKVLSLLYPKITESNLKCNAYALNMLSFYDKNVNTNHLISYLDKESLHQIDTLSQQNKGSSNIIFNVLQVVSSLIRVHQYTLANKIYSCLLQQDIDWKGVPLFVRSCFLLVTERLHAASYQLLVRETEIEELTIDLFHNLDLPYINKNNSFTGATDYSTHEIGYLLYFSIQLSHIKTHANDLNTVLALMNKLHQAFIRDKILVENTRNTTSKVINNSGVALIATAFFIASTETKDYRYGNAALFLTDYLYETQNRYQGLVPNTTPLWSSKSPLQYPLWTQYYMLLATTARESFLNSLK